MTKLRDHWIPKTCRELKMALVKVYPDDKKLSRMKKNQLLAIWCSLCRSKMREAEETRFVCGECQMRYGDYKITIDSKTRWVCNECLKGWV